MKHLTLLATSIVLLAFGPKAMAAPATSTQPAPQAAAASEEITPRLTQGSWAISGSAWYEGKADTKKREFEFGTSVSPRYFITDQLAVGPDFSLTIEDTGRAYGMIGPVGSLHFSRGRLAPYGLIGIRFGLTQDSVAQVIRSGLGLDYFLTPSVAIGPFGYFNMYTERSSSPGIDYVRWGLNLGLSVYL